jgi:UDPglucose 6-dehydrogenase
VVGFAGLTHLGLVSAVCAAEKGFRVVGFDPAGTPQTVSEPELDRLRTRNAERLRFTADAGELRECDLIYVAPDVPTDDTGASDLGPLEALLERVFGAARPDATIVILSQVPPGFTRSKRRAGRILHYQVETLIFGRAVERALQPERYIVGCEDPAQPLPGAYRRFLEAHGCPILPMRYESAEFAKISINFFLVSSVSTTNTLAELCEKIGADWAEIAPALRLDRRIGPHAYLAPGLGIAGGNLERDLATAVRSADQLGTDAGVVRAWLANSAHRRDWALRTLHRELLAKAGDPVIAVLGLAYKQDTHSTKNSPALALLAHLHPFAVRLYDPVVPAVAAAHPRSHAAHSELDACEGADALLVMTPWKQFSSLDAAEAARLMRGRIVLDPYAVLDAGAYRRAGFAYRTLGLGS